MIQKKVYLVLRTLYFHIRSGGAFDSVIGLRNGSCFLGAIRPRLCHHRVVVAALVGVKRVSLSFARVGNDLWHYQYEQKKKKLYHIPSRVYLYKKSTIWFLFSCCWFRFFDVITDTKTNPTLEINRIASDVCSMPLVC